CRPCRSRRSCASTPSCRVRWTRSSASSASRSCPR
ncbi:MAG: hypothetical protein AVDCRST_MAG79-1746, partial [uncultured Thermoleophilia bacterium]